MPKITSIRKRTSRKETRGPRHAGRLPELEPRIGAPRPPTPPEAKRERTPRQAQAEGQLRDIADRLNSAWQPPTRPPPPGRATRTILPAMLQHLAEAQRAVAAVLAENNAEIRRLRQAERQAPPHSAQAVDARRANYVLQLMAPGIKAWHRELKDQATKTLLAALHEAIRQTKHERGKPDPGPPPTRIKGSQKMSAQVDWSHPATLLQLELAQAKVAPRERVWRVGYRAAQQPQDETRPQARAAA